MKRILSSALILSVIALPGLSGCGDETKVKEQETVSSPTGTTTTTTEKKIESKGDNPPPNSEGQTAK